MSENLVRKASVEAAKEIWVLKNTSSVPSEIQSQMADIIESHFAPVVAAADRATAELRVELDKCRTTYETALASRSVTIASLKAQLAARESIFKWLLGEEGDFPMRTETFGAYWWRPALRQRIAALSAPAKERTIKTL